MDETIAADGTAGVYLHDDCDILPLPDIMFLKRPLDEPIRTVRGRAAY